MCSSSDVYIEPKNLSEVGRKTVVMRTSFCISLDINALILGSQVAANMIRFESIASPSCLQLLHESLAHSFLQMNIKNLSHQVIKLSSSNLNSCLTKVIQVLSNTSSSELFITASSMKNIKTFLVYSI